MHEREMALQYKVYNLTTLLCDQCRAYVKVEEIGNRNYYVEVEAEEWLGFLKDKGVTYKAIRTPSGVLVMEQRPGDALTYRRPETIIYCEHTEKKCEIVLRKVELSLRVN